MGGRWGGPLVEYSGYSTAGLRTHPEFTNRYCRYRGIMKAELWDSDKPQWETQASAAGNRIDISGTTHKDGRSTAEWIGHGPEPDAEFSLTMRGFAVTVIGDLYGPAGQEIGGVLSGSRGATDTDAEQILIGRHRRLPRRIVTHAVGPPGALKVASNSTIAGENRFTLPRFILRQGGLTNSRRGDAAVG